MKIYSRNYKHLKDSVYEEIVYDDPLEANLDGIFNIRPWYDPEIKKGDYVVYPDGRTTKVLNVTRNKANMKDGTPRYTGILYTILNSISINANADICFDYFPSTFLSQVRDIRKYSDPNKLDRRKISFVTDWLLNGMTIVQAAKKNLRGNFRLYGKDCDKTSADKLYSFIMLPWFTELLRTNRLIRDKYMSLIDAFDRNSIDDDYIAKKLKDDVESDNVKLHINAINKMVEIRNVVKSLSKNQSYNDVVDAYWNEMKLIDGGGKKSLPSSKTINKNNDKEILDEIFRGQSEDEKEELRAANF